ncbi:hypothetical protein ALP74_200162 [Pseudomonas coronafaciens pv. garcae]|uniref:Uncharacterized protein n=1 Tax=Pseudomonas coronafaciens pv. garcae TaxID=251653 RepID=A0AB37QK12_9PSED|nr:hypothetical protein ALP74_200162 [Pseudomonas coronafaciens pv. garcae]
MIYCVCSPRLCSLPATILVMTLGQFLAPLYGATQIQEKPAFWRAFCISWLYA